MLDCVLAPGSRLLAWNDSTCTGTEAPMRSGRDPCLLRPWSLEPGAGRPRTTAELIRCGRACSVRPDGLPRSPVRRARAATFAHVRLEFGAELLHERLHRRRRGV